jgi:hypothetical protein
MYDVVLRASAPFLVGSPHKNTIFSLLSLRGDDPVYLFVLLNVGRGRFTITALAMVLMEFPALYLYGLLLHERVSVGKVTCSL